MKVLHINEHLAQKGGVETYLFSLLPIMAERGVGSVLAYGSGNADEYKASYAVPALGRAGFSDQRVAREQVHAVLEKERPDLIHIHNVQNVGAIQAALDFAPTVVTTHDYRWVCPANSFFYKRTQAVCNRTCGPGCFTTTLTKHCLTPRPSYAAYFYYRARWAIHHAKRFARVIAPSEGARSRYVEAGFPETRTTTLPYFCPVPPAQQPRSLPEQPTITYLGRIAPNKGYQIFVQALGLLPSKVRGILVGDLTNEAHQRIREIARTHGCDERLELRPWATREEIAPLLDQTSIFVFPSLWPETLGIVGLEALARGVPVVASDIGGVPEWCIEGKTGFRVPPNNAQAIATAIDRLLTDSNRLMQFGQNGIDLIRQRFLPTWHADRLIQLYTSAIDTKMDATYKSH